jgi:hypothetical protein
MVVIHFCLNVLIPWDHNPGDFFIQISVRRLLSGGVYLDEQMFRCIDTDIVDVAVTMRYIVSKRWHVVCFIKNIYEAGR